MASPGSPIGDHLAVVHHHGPLAVLADGVVAVAHHDDGPALALELLHVVEALALECCVAHRQHLVDEQHVGLDVHRHREPESHVHARGVELDLVVDEVLELGEGHDVVEALLDLGTGEPEQRAVQVDVVAARELGLEAGAELEHRGEAAPHPDLARWWA